MVRKGGASLLFFSYLVLCIWTVTQYVEKNVVKFILAIDRFTIGHGLVQVSKV